MYKSWIPQVVDCSLFSSVANCFERINLLYLWLCCIFLCILMTRLFEALSIDPYTSCTISEQRTAHNFWDSGFIHLIIQYVRTYIQLVVSVQRYLYETSINMLFSEPSKEKYKHFKFVSLGGGLGGSLMWFRDDRKVC